MLLITAIGVILFYYSLSPPECPEKCVPRACTADGECCHPQCLGSCTVPGSDTACAACVHYYHQGRCVADCPPGTYKFEGWRCISAELCSKLHLHLADHDSLIIHGGECMSECPSGYTRTAPNRWAAIHPDAGWNGTTWWLLSSAWPWYQFHTLLLVSNLTAATVKGGTSRGNHLPTVSL